MGVRGGWEGWGVVGGGGGGCTGMVTSHDSPLELTVISFADALYS